MNWFSNIKFVRKIQGGFSLLAVVTTIITVVGLVQLNKITTVKNKIFQEFIEPQSQINDVYTNFQNIQFIMMQLSIPAFANKFSANAGEYYKLSAENDSTLKLLSQKKLTEHIKKELKEVQSIWTQYKNLVADAILSASATQSYDMAADIATTSGENVGLKLLNKFKSIHNNLLTEANNLNASVSESVGDSIKYQIGGMIIGALIFVLCFFFIAPAMSKPLEKLKLVVKEFALGNYKSEIKIESNDEIGELAQSLRLLKKAQEEKIHAAEQIAAGIPNKVPLASEEDSLAIAFNKEVDTLKELLNEADILIKANKEGNLKLRSNTNKFSGEWRKLIEGINSILDAISAPIMESSEILMLMAEGNLAVEVKGNYKGDHQLIKNNINTVNKSLSNAIQKVNEAVISTSNTSNEISTTISEMAAGAEGQSQQSREIASAVEQMTKTILETTKNANSAAVAAKDAGNTAKSGGEVVSKTIEGMHRIAEVVKQSAETVKELGKGSDQIGEIVQVIEEIANQTNLLALNAAIEAARAGEQGRGFAVVADEVSKLAERTTKATKEIADMIKQIQKDTSNAVKSMSQGTEEVEKGIELADEAGKSLNEIIDGANKVVDIASQVAAASEEQSAASEQISKNIESISEVTNRSSEGIQYVANAAGNLNELTENLQRLISSFKIKVGNDAFEVKINNYEDNFDNIHSNNKESVF